MSDTKSNNRKPVDHGEVRWTINPPKPRPFIPRVLRTSVLERVMDHDEACGKYGKWPCKILKDVRVNGVFMKPGDSCILPGNIAAFMAFDGDAEFVDGADRAAEEQKVIVAAR